MRKAGIISVTIFCFILNSALIFAQETRESAGDFSYQSGIEGSLTERLENHVYTLAADSMMGRKAGSSQSLIAAEYIAEQFREIGIEPYGESGYFQTFSPDMIIGSAKVSYRNVIGIIPGNGRLSEEYIVLGAHYDHLGTETKGGKTIIYNGADDNASGVSTLIELGRNLYEIRDKLKRSVILVAFDAEETGLVGSYYFVNNPVIPIENIKLMISLDMVGWLHAAGNRLYYYGTGTVKQGKKTLINSDIIPAGLYIETKKFESSVMTATDTEPFAHKRIPTFHVTTGTKSPYHKPEDEAHLIDYNGMGLITRHLTGVTELLSTDEQLEASGQRSFKHKDYDKLFEFGITATVGSNFLRYTSGSLRGKTALFFGGGLYTQFNMGYLGLRPEVLYERNGAQYPDGRLWTNSLTVPVSVMLQTPKSLVGGMYVAAGGYYRYAFSGTQGGKKIDFKESFYRNEAGVQWGMGLWLYNITLGINFRYGLTDLLRETNGEGNIRNRSTNLVVSYRF